MALLRRLASGLPVEDLASLPPRQRALLVRLEAAGYVVRHDYGGESLWLTKGARALVPPDSSQPQTRQVTRAALDALDLRDVPSFHIGQRPRPIGRPRIPAPRIYLKVLPDADWDPTKDLDELALALLVFKPKACDQLIRDHPRRRWQLLRDRIHAEVLEERAAYFGIKKLIDLRPPRATRATRHDAYLRARTEPTPHR